MQTPRARFDPVRIHIACNVPLLHVDRHGGRPDVDGFFFWLLEAERHVPLTRDVTPTVPLEHKSHPLPVVAIKLPHQVPDDLRHHHGL